MRILASPAFANKKINPYNALLYGEMNAIAPGIAEYSHKKALWEKFDILHFHWPDGFINPPGLLKAWQRVFLFALVIIAAKARGAKIVWTVHNIRPHDAWHPLLAQAFMNGFIRCCDGFIFMSEQSRKTFFEEYRLPAEIPNAIIPHGHYRNSYPAAIERSFARQQLGLPQEKQLLLSFGMIKPYKNIDALIETFVQAQPDNYVLVIAGNTDSPELATRLQELKGANENVYLFLKFIPDDELHWYFSAADIVILPYKAILNSGALLLALSFSKPVIAPAIGAFLSLQQELGTQWINCYANDLQPETLAAAITQLQQADRQAVCPLTNYNWDHLARATLNFYHQLIHNPVHQQK